MQIKKLWYRIKLTGDKEVLHMVNKKYDWDEVTIINVYKVKDV